MIRVRLCYSGMNSTLIFSQLAGTALFAYPSMHFLMFSCPPLTDQILTGPQQGVCPSKPLAMPSSGLFPHGLGEEPEGFALTSPQRKIVPQNGPSIQPPLILSRLSHLLDPGNPLGCVCARRIPDIGGARGEVSR